MVDLKMTKRQQEIFTFIKRYASKYGYPPTVREIGKAVGLASSSTVHAHLANLEKYGVLRRDPTKPRAIELLFDKAKRAVAPDEGMLPLVGRVAAGQPVLAEENIEDYVQVPSVAGGDEGEYVLQVSGESMRDAGILAGRLRSRAPAEHRGGRRHHRRAARRRGDGQALLPRARPRATAAREPRDGADPHAATCEVLGRVVGVFRKV